MKTKINFFATCILVLGTMLLGQPHLVAQEQQEEVDLEEALRKLQQSMGNGAEVVPEHDSKVDKALESLDEVVIPLPEAVINSSIPLETVTPARAQQAAKIIAATPMAGDLEADYRQSGTMMSLMLWNGAQTELQGLLNRILQQLYSADSKMDPSLIRILVNSNPIPMIQAPTPVDFNKEINQKKRIELIRTLNIDQKEEEQQRTAHVRQMEENVKAKKSVWQYRPSRNFLTKEEVEKQISALSERMGIQIGLSAGLIASAKNVDEIAGQLALVLAAHNPKIYGFEEDERFTKHRDNYELIETIIQQSSLASKEAILETRNRLQAGLSAIERLVRGGFNPWAIADYEERVYGWMADVYLTEKKHSLGRALLDAKKYNLLDASRPFRINLYTAYVHYLQKVPRGKGMNLSYTELSARMKFIRARMWLFTKPFFSPTALATVPLVVGGGVIASTLGTSDSLQYAWHAVQATTNALPAFDGIKETVGAAGDKFLSLMHGTGHSIRQALPSMPSLTPTHILDATYHGAKDTSSSTPQVAKDFFTRYQTAIAGAGAAAGAVTGAKFFAKYGSSLVEKLKTASSKFRSSRDVRVIETPTALETPIERTDFVRTFENQNSQPVTEDIDDEPFATQVWDQPGAVVLGELQREISKPKKSIRERMDELRDGWIIFSGRIQTKAGIFQDRLGEIYVDSKNKFSMIADSTQRQAVSAGQSIKARGTNAGQAIKNGSISAKNSAVNAGKTVGRAAITAKDATIGALVATPGVISHIFRYVVRQGSDGADYSKEKVKAGIRRSKAALQRSKNFGARHGSAILNKMEQVVDATPGALNSAKDSTVQTAISFGRGSWALGGRLATGTGNLAVSAARLGKDAGIGSLRLGQAAAIGGARLGRDAAVGSLRLGQAAAISGARLGKSAAIGSARLGRDTAVGTWNVGTRMLVGTSRFLFITAPVGTWKAGVSASEQLYDWTSRTYANHKEVNRVRDEAEVAQTNRLLAGQARVAAAFKRETTSYAALVSILSDLKVLSGMEKSSAQAIRTSLGIYTMQPDTIINLVAGTLRAWADYAEVHPPTQTDATDLLAWLAWPDTNIFGVPSVIEAGVRVYDAIEKQNLLPSELTPFLAQMKHYSQINKNKQSGSSSQDRSRVIVQALSNKQAVKVALKELFLKNEADFLQWLTDPSTTDDQIREFVIVLAEEGSTVEGIANEMRLNAAVKALSPIRRARLKTLDTRFSQVPQLHKTGALLRSARWDLAQTWVSRASSIRQLVNLIENECREYHLKPEEFRVALSDLVRDRSDLIHERRDFDLLYDRGYFWTDAIDTPIEKAMPLERPLVELLKERRKQFGDSPAWKYDPIVSERMHRAAEGRLKALKFYPKDFRDQLEYWKSLTSRGVSTVTDTVLSHLLAVGTPEQISELELYAVTQGRVFDQGLRDEFALRQLKASPAYLALMARKNDAGSDRSQLINDVIVLAQTLLTDLGLRYREFMEHLSEDIQSTYDEAETIDNAKAKRLAVALKENKDQVTDSRIRMFQDIIPHIKTWKDQNQFEFLLYLRGSIEATPFIRAQFPQFGPERIRQIYQGLPLEGARFAVEMYLSQTLLARKGVDSSWGKKLIAYLVKPTISAEETAEVAKLPAQERLAYQQRLEATHRYSQLLLEGLLVGIDKAGNARLQKSVLSALIAMKPNQKNSVGETIKKILEQFPGVGPKVGQFLVATQLLPSDINEVLIGTQDGTLPPERFETYVDIAQIVGRGKDIGVELFNFLGGGSIKYSRSAKERTTGWQVALQIFREDVQNSVDVNIKAINYMIAHLIKVDGKQWAFLKVIVDGAMHAVEREREFLKEAEKTKVAREQLYKDRFNDERFTVQVPIQLKLNERLLASKFASGKPFWKLSKEDQQIVGEKILAMESELLYPSGNFPQNHAFIFDTDRHAGNYLIDVTLKNGKKHYTIYPIDFGQLTKVTVAQRDRVAEMMALAVMFSNGGSNDWLGQKLASLFGLQGKVVSDLQKNLDAFFPVSKAGPQNSVVTAYFSLIAALNETIHPTGDEHPAWPQNHPDLKAGRLDFIYTDYLRAIIQFNQYENNILVTKNTRSPRAHLEAQTKKALATYLKDVRLSKVQQALVQAQNVRNWVSAKRTGARYEPINIRMTEQELENKSLMKQGASTFQRATGPAAAPAVCSSIASSEEAPL